MKIKINSNNDGDVVVKQKDMYIWIPNFLVLNNTALNIAKKQKGGQEPNEDIMKLFHEILAK